MRRAPASLHGKIQTESCMKQFVNILTAAQVDQKKVLTGIRHQLDAVAHHTHLV